MNIVCPECLQKYDDTYRNTSCPHETFEMHCSVFVNGQQGCAHTVEELRDATESPNPTAPNPDCPLNKLRESFAEDFYK